MPQPELDYSIVVPMYNQEPYIEGCIRALLALDYPRDRYEVIIVDNNSSDGSAAIVERFPDVRLIREPEQGDFAARNRGLAESRGQVIAFTDSDTAPDPDWLSSIGRVLADDAIEVIIGYLQFGDGGRLLSMLEAYEAHRGDVVFESQEPEIYYGYTCNQVVRRRAFDRLGPFPRVFRNSDTVFTRAVVDEFGVDAAVYSREVRVRRLEVATFWEYLEKQHTYGRDYRRYEHNAQVRALSARERAALYIGTCRRERYGPLRVAGLLAALACGAIAYESGRALG